MQERIEWRLRSILTNPPAGEMVRVNLRGAQLHRANLESAFLNESDLRAAGFHRARLRAARLRDANLAGSDLELADLREAELVGADLKGAHLRLANLAAADVRGADLSGATGLSCAQLKTARLDVNTRLPEALSCPDLNASESKD